MQQTINEERLLFEQNKNPFVFAKPNDPNLTANGGYDYQDDNQHGGNGYGHTDSQNGRYGYDHQAENQYGRNGYGQAGSQYGRYGYDHQPDYQYNGNGCSYRTDDQYGGCGNSRADKEGYGINRRISSNQRHHFHGNGSYINSKYFWGNHQNNTDTEQLKQNQLIGRVL